MQPIPRISLYKATDSRCYNGCPSSDLDREWKSKDEAVQTLKELGIRVTYFPAGEFYVGFTTEKVEILTEDCSSFEEAANKAIAAMEERKIKQ